MAVGWIHSRKSLIFCSFQFYASKPEPVETVFAPKIIDDMLDCFSFQLNIRDEEVQRLNTKIRELHSEIRDLQAQLELKDERVSNKIPIT